MNQPSLHHASRLSMDPKAKRYFRARSRPGSTDVDWPGMTPLRHVRHPLLPLCHAAGIVLGRSSYLLDAMPSLPCPGRGRSWETSEASGCQGVGRRGSPAPGHGGLGFLQAPATPTLARKPSFWGPALQPAFCDRKALPDLHLVGGRNERASNGLRGLKNRRVRGRSDVPRRAEPAQAWS